MIQSSSLLRASIVFTLFLRLACADPLQHLNEPCDPYYVGLDFPKLTTPQWYGERGVDAVVILSIDDMRDPAKYETYLRPILDRLKEIDGKAPVSIFTNEVKPDDEQLQAFLKEGLSLECHTIDHPCPLLCDGDFSKAKSTYDRCVDMLANVPNMRPVAFRMPCCDSLNTPSPRFWTEIFDRATTDGNYLAIDSSVFNITTNADPDLPAQITKNEKGQSRFRHYLPFPSFVNTIENYPYPYVIGGTCWEFPCVVPSDWEAQHVQQPNNPDTVRDLKIALDATVIKKGAMSVVFHPHGWIRAEQMVQLIDHAQETYGKRVKFITFSDAQSKLNEHLLDGHPIRNVDGATGVRMVDVNRDGYLDVVIPLADDKLMTRIWDNETKTWTSSTDDIPGDRNAFGLLAKKTMMLVPDANQKRIRAFEFQDKRWSEFETGFFKDADDAAKAILEARSDAQFQLVDLDGDGSSELLGSHGGKTFVYSRIVSGWSRTKFGLPDGVQLRTKSGGDGGLRFRDIDGDNQLDIVFSNGSVFAVHLFDSIENGWNPATRSGKSGDAGAIPAIVRGDGSNNGAWFHSEHLWVQNEQTDRMPDKVARVTHAGLLGKEEPFKEGPEPAAASKGTADEYPPAKSPQEGLASFAKRDGMHIELVASEPQIVDPVAFDWAADGSLFVAEMRDYPNGISWRKQGDKIGEPGGRIKRLTDTDGDGKFETATVFLDNIPFPNGIKSWRDGVLITAAPNILYAEDTTGDGRADKQQTLYVGFGEGNQQHRVNGMRWGLDGWLHLANGDSGGKIRSTQTGEVVNISGRDLRILPDEGLLEAQSGQTQSGRSRDDNGNWFGGNNSSPVWHYVLDEQYLKRNPHYAPPSVRREISAVPGAAPIFPTSNTVTRFNDFDRANRYTSACSPEIFRESCHLKNDPRRFVYVCEPVHNLVGREVITDNGLTFRSERAENERDRELITSSDNWCRPVMARTGPDGALWFADMYRLVIEHPEWVPKEWQDRLDLRGGEDKGRIYRVVFDAVESEFSGASWKELQGQPTNSLVSSLDSSNGTLRDMIQQQLTWRQDKSTAEGLRKLLTEATWPATRIHAMHLLDSLSALTADDLVQSMAQPDATARHAVAIVTRRDSEDGPISLSRAYANAMVGLADERIAKKDSEGLRCIQQVAYALGDIQNRSAGRAMADILIRYADDPLMVASVMSSVTKENVAEVLAPLSLSLDCPDSILSDLFSIAVSNGQWNAVNTAIVNLDNDGDRYAIGWAKGLVESLRRKNVSPYTSMDVQAQLAMANTISRAQKRAINSKLKPQERIEGIRLLGIQGPGDRVAFQTPNTNEAIKILLKLLSPKTANEVQIASLEQLGTFDKPQVVDGLINKWPLLTPTLRQKSLDILLSRDAWVPTIIEAAIAGDLPPEQISARHRQKLLNSKWINELSAKIIGGVAESSRSDVIARYASVADLKGNIVTGKQHFTKSCATCHRLADLGTAVGPDLTALTDKSVPAMLTAILDPNAAIEDKYLSYGVVTEDGRQFSGLLAAETATAITLQQADGKPQQILRSEIEELVATGKSHMPEGLEQDLPPQAVADIIAFVQSTSTPSKQFPGNTPQVAPVRDDGSIRLFAMHARIYGTAIAFEQQYRNLGMWSDANDHAVWRLDVPKAGEYKVQVDYACEASCSGNRIQFLTNGQKLIGELPVTGSWNDYTTRSVGTLQLPKGEVEVTLKADGTINKFLGDFRTIILEPK